MKQSDRLNVGDIVKFHGWGGRASGRLGIVIKHLAGCDMPTILVDSGFKGVFTMGQFEVVSAGG
jgi:hypothetical protein